MKPSDVAKSIVSRLIEARPHVFSANPKVEEEAALMIAQELVRAVVDHKLPLGLSLDVGKLGKCNYCRAVQIWLLTPDLTKSAAMSVCGVEFDPTRGPAPWDWHAFNTKLANIVSRVQ